MIRMVPNLEEPILCLFFLQASNIVPIFAPRFQKRHSEVAVQTLCGNIEPTMIINLANQSFTTLTDSLLPALSGSAVTYCKDHNIYLSKGYTSAAGNTYFQGLCHSDRLVVMYEFGQGWAHLFLNGICLYCFKGREKKLISRRSYSCQFFNEAFARKECIGMLKNFILIQARMAGASVQPLQLTKFSELMIREVFNTPLHRQIA